jgi:hypothetical protein
MINLPFQGKLLPLASIACALLIIGVLALYLLRKNLPYQFEFVPIREGVVIITTTGWNRNDLDITLTGNSDGASLRALMKGEKNQCRVEELRGGETYSIRVRRSDLLGRVRYQSFNGSVVVPEMPPQYVVLVGASVGKAWNLPSLPDRTGFKDFVFGCREKYGYDKSEVIQRLSESYKPDIVIIKECSAYFPKHRSQMVEKIPSWIATLSDNDIIPILATCCPVTETNDAENAGRQVATNEFNRFIRAFAAEHDIVLLDLAQALEISKDAHHLRNEYAQPDGLHLTPQAYEKLDQLLISVIEGMEVSSPDVLS